MADYYPLLARALEGLAEPDSSARGAVYERARAALAGQLASIAPPLDAQAIDRERASLDEAIGRIERSYETRRGPAALDPGGRGDDGVGSGPPEIDQSGARRPRIDAAPPIRRGGRRGRSVLVALGLFAVVAPIAVGAWLWRDQPGPAPSVEPSRPPPVVAANGDPKRPERVGGPDAPPSSEPQRPLRSDPGGAGPPSRPAEAPGSPPDVPVGQKAGLLEENTADPAQPKVTNGRVVWQIDNVSGGQGQPLEIAVRANVDVPDAKLSLTLLLKRNRDTTLTASSHTLELLFATAGTGEDARGVRAVNPLLLRPDGNERGVPLAGLAVPVKENAFLIVLSNLKSDLDRNTDLLLNRNWMELPLQFSTGTRATLVFEKGVTGERVFRDAFRQWAQP